MKKQVATINLKPTPEAYVNMLLTLINESTIPEERKWAKQELIKAMTFAYEKGGSQC